MAISLPLLLTVTCLFASCEKVQCFRVINGKNAPMDDWMFTVQLIVQTSVSSKETVCTGSLVSITGNVFILTAAHCFTFRHTKLDSDLLSFIRKVGNSQVFKGTVEIQFPTEATKSARITLNANFINKHVRIHDGFLLSEPRDVVTSCEEGLSHVPYTDPEHDLAVIVLTHECVELMNIKAKQLKPRYLDKEHFERDAAVHQICQIAGWGPYGTLEQFAYKKYIWPDRLQVGEFLMLDERNATDRKRCIDDLHSAVNDELCLSWKSSNTDDQALLGSGDSGAPILCGRKMAGVLTSSRSLPLFDRDEKFVRYEKFTSYGISIDHALQFVSSQNWNLLDKSWGNCKLL